MICESPFAILVNKGKKKPLAFQYKNLQLHFWDRRALWVHEPPLCQKEIPDRSKILLLENVAPSRPDKVPGQRHPHDIIGNGLDGGGGILLADLGRVKSVVQISGPGKKVDRVFLHSLTWKTV